MYYPLNTNKFDEMHFNVAFFFQNNNKILIEKPC